MVSTFGKVAKRGQMDGMDQVYFYSTINIFQNDPLKSYVSLYTMIFRYIRPIISKLSLLVDTYLSFLFYIRIWSCLI